MSARQRVFIGLGANLGDPATQLRQAIAALTARFGPGVEQSSLWISTPVDCPQGSPDFVNAVVSIEVVADHSPLALLQELQQMETRFGVRDRQRLNNPRYMDLDLLLWGDRRIEMPVLRVPHPRATERAFVMKPLAELVPGLVWPGSLCTVGEIAAVFEPSLCYALSE